MAPGRWTIFTRKIEERKMREKQAKKGQRDKKKRAERLVRKGKRGILKVVLSLGSRLKKKQPENPLVFLIYFPFFSSHVTSLRR